MDTKKKELVAPFPRSVVTGTFDFGFLLRLMLKDVKLFEEEKDLTAIAQLYERWAGVEIRATTSY